MLWLDFKISMEEYSIMTVDLNVKTLLQVLFVSHIFGMDIDIYQYIIMSHSS